MYNKETYKKYYEKNKSKILWYRHRYNKLNRNKILKQKQLYFKESQNIINELKINGCAICGYNKNNACLDFHHVNPKDKQFRIQARNLTKKTFVEELNKCILLCCNCHREIENEEG